jgi:hypothetical protein
MRCGADDVPANGNFDPRRSGASFVSLESSFPDLAFASESFWHVDHVDPVLQVYPVAARSRIVIDYNGKASAGPDSHSCPRDP